MQGLTITPTNGWNIIATPVQDVSIIIFVVTLSIFRCVRIIGTSTNQSPKWWYWSLKLTLNIQFCATLAAGFFHEAVISNYYITIRHFRCIYN